MDDIRDKAAHEPCAQNSANSRGYKSLDDLQAMIRLLENCRTVERISDYPGIIDLHEAMAMENIRKQTRLWFATQHQLAAFAYVDHYNNLWFELDQRSFSPTLEQEIVDWGVKCIRQLAQTPEEPLTLDASCRIENSVRLAFFERHGFVRQEEQSIQMVRSLAGTIPDPQIPAGFSIRHIQGEQEVEQLVALHRAAFGTDNMTIEERLAMMHVPDYDPELDLLAIAPDGRLAALCVCAIYQEENRRSGKKVGYTDPIATHPEFMRQGLALALLHTGLHMLRQRGMDTARLGTSSENIAMQGVAQAAGFQIESSTLWFSKNFKG